MARQANLVDLAGAGLSIETIYDAYMRIVRNQTSEIQRQIDQNLLEHLKSYFNDYFNNSKKIVCENDND